MQADLILYDSDPFLSSRHDCVTILKHVNLLLLLCSDMSGQVSQQKCRIFQVAAFHHPISHFDLPLIWLSHYLFSLACLAGPIAIHMCCVFHHPSKGSPLGFSGPCHVTIKAPRQVASPYCSNLSSFSEVSHTGGVQRPYSSFHFAFCFVKKYLYFFIWLMLTSKKSSHPLS